MRWIRALLLIAISSPLWLFLGTVQIGRPKLTTFGDFYKAVSWPYTPPPTKISMRNNVSEQSLALSSTPTDDIVCITSKSIFDCTL